MVRGKREGKERKLAGRRLSRFLESFFVCDIGAGKRLRDKAKNAECSM
jgi:hypothetical protein